MRERTLRYLRCGFRNFEEGDKSRIGAAIQVCYELNDDNMEREFGGLVEAMENSAWTKASYSPITRRTC